MLKDADITADRTVPHNISQHHLFIDVRYTDL